MIGAAPSNPNKSIAAHLRVSRRGRFSWVEVRTVTPWDFCGEPNSGPGWRQWCHADTVVLAIWLWWRRHDLDRTEVADLVERLAGASEISGGWRWLPRPPRSA
jgi:hypothetical protein